MKKPNLILVSAVVFLSFLISCKKKNDEPTPDVDPPVTTTTLNKILFEAEVGSSPSIYQLMTMNTDGSGELQLTNFSNGSNSVYTGGACFSPDGTKIVLTTNKDATGGEIYIMNSDGTGITRLTNNLRTEQFPTFSPNGNKILFEAEVGSSPSIYQLMTMNTDGSGELQLTNFSNGSNSVYTGGACFSPDGTKIVFTTNKDATGGEIYIMNSDGTGITRLTNNLRTEQFPTFSPNGNKILFEAEVGSSPSIYQLMTMNTDGSGELQLTNFSNGSNSVYTGGACFSPDGTKIVLTTNKDATGGEIYIMNSDGTGITRLTNNLRTEQFPKWK
jgi:Tol biopolymer transport system component